MKVQTRGLLADLSTMKPPGPFSPLKREAPLGGPWSQARPLAHPPLFLAHLGCGWKKEGSCWSSNCDPAQAGPGTGVPEATALHPHPPCDASTLLRQPAAICKPLGAHHPPNPQLLCPGILGQSSHEGVGWASPSTPNQLLEQCSAGGLQEGAPSQEVVRAWAVRFTS